MIITVCGSTRFAKEIAHVRAKLTLDGHIVLGPEVLVRSDPAYSDLHDAQAKVDLDELHFRKIDMSAAIFVVNPGNYIGNSTRKEIDYARSQGKSIIYHEVWYEPEYRGDETFWQQTNYPMPEN